ncbi:MAG: methyltransferase domain-containing protein [Thermodesulfobacteriota bacterium]|nr:methyltransferase domain-containing protein [Thermodesulfobacteriota bacterium]
MQSMQTSDDLIRFVKQDDNVSNAIWFLRTLEWEWTTRLIGLPGNPNGRVLDVASEVRVSSLLFQKGWNIWRVDFSKESAIHARKYGPKFTGHVIIDPSQLNFSFNQNSFEAVVCVGPFDFKFLNKHVLLTEIKKLLKANGKCVLSMASDKSPYCSPSSQKKFHYWSSEEIDRVLKEWKVGKVKRMNVPQPSFIYSKIFNNRYMNKSIFNALVTTPLLWLCPYFPKKVGKYVILCLNKGFDS